MEAQRQQSAVAGSGRRGSKNQKDSTPRWRGFKESERQQPAVEIRGGGRSASTLEGLSVASAGGIFQDKHLQYIYICMMIYIFLVVDQSFVNHSPAAGCHPASLTSRPMHRVVKKPPDIASGAQGCQAASLTTRPMHRVVRQPP